jgi:hypothetical protein
MEPLTIRPEWRTYLSFEQYQFVDVTFTSADYPTRISHTLTPTTPTNVIYFPVRKSAACDIYDTRDAGDGYEWSRAAIVLKATAPATVTLFLAVRRPV